jgi:hypothetical protein
MTAMKKTTCPDCCGCVYILPGCPDNDEEAPEEIAVSCSVLDAILSGLEEPTHPGNLVCPPTGTPPLYGVDITPPHTHLVFLLVRVGGRYACYFYCEPDEDKADGPPAGVPLVTNILFYDLQQCGYVCTLWCEDPNDECGGENEPPWELIQGCGVPDGCPFDPDPVNFPNNPLCDTCAPGIRARVLMENVRQCYADGILNTACPSATKHPPATVGTFQSGFRSMTRFQGTPDFGPPNPYCLYRLRFYPPDVEIADGNYRCNTICQCPQPGQFNPAGACGGCAMGFILEIWCSSGVVDEHPRWRWMMMYNGNSASIEPKVDGTCPDPAELLLAAHYCLPMRDQECSCINIFGQCVPTMHHIAAGWGPVVEWTYTDDDGRPRWHVKPPVFTQTFSIPGTTSFGACNIPNCDAMTLSVSFRGEE